MDFITDKVAWNPAISYACGVAIVADLVVLIIHCHRRHVVCIVIIIREGVIPTTSMVMSD